MSTPSMIRRSRRVAALLTILAPPALAQGGGTQVDQVTVIPRTFQFERLVYFTDGLAGGLDLGRVRLGGEGLVNLATELALGNRGIAVDRRRCHVFVGSGNNNEVLRYDTTGGGRTVIQALNSWPRGVAIDEAGERLYYIVPGQAVRIRSCRLDGSDERDLVRFNDIPTGITPYSIHFDGARSRIYWFDQSFGNFRAALLDANGDVVCIKNVYYTGIAVTDGVVAYDVDVVNGYLYWAVSAGGVSQTIYRWEIPDDGMDPCASSTCDMTTCPAEIFMQDTNPAVVITPFCLSVLPENEPGAAQQEGAVAWIYNANLLRWRELDEPWPAPIHEAAAGSLPLLSVNSIELAPGPSICFAQIPSVVGPGPRLHLRIADGSPGAPVSVRLVELDGRPLSVPLHTGTLGADGELVFALPVTRAVSGVRARLEARILEPGSECLLLRETEVELP